MQKTHEYSYRDNEMKKIWTVLIILTVVFIFLQSIVPENKSAIESVWVTEQLVNPLFSIIGKAFKFDFVRKVAHVIEFFVLTVFIYVLLKRPVRVFYASFTISFLDESLQILTKRGALISDVWIDLIGIVFGVIICFLYFRHSLRKKSKIN